MVMDRRLILDEPSAHRQQILASGRRARHRWRKRSRRCDPGSARLEEAAAYRAALEVFREAGATQYLPKRRDLARLSCPETGTGRPAAQSFGRWWAARELQPVSTALCLFRQAVAPHGTCARKRASGHSEPVPLGAVRKGVTTITSSVCERLSTPTV